MMVMLLEGSNMRYCNSRELTICHSREWVWSCWLEGVIMVIGYRQLEGVGKGSVTRGRWHELSSRDKVMVATVGAQWWCNECNWMKMICVNTGH